MTQSNLPAPRGAAGAALKVVSVLFTNLCPTLAKRHQRLSGEIDAEYEISKQKAIENNLRDRSILFPPGTTMEHMNQAFLEEMLISLGKTENRNAVFDKFCSYFPDDEIEKLPPLREEIALPLFEYAGECTTKEAQERWAKLIAGECRNPGSISLRTVRILNSMSTEDAEILESFASICSNGMLFLKNAQGDNLDKIIHLSSLGLIVLSHTMYINIPLNDGHLLERKNKLGYMENISSKEIKFSGYGLTRSGEEIMNLSSVKLDATKIMKNLGLSEHDIKIVIHD